MAKKLPFSVGDYVVYPTHGVGRVVDVATEKISGYELRLFVINFAVEKMMLRVPVDKAENSGLRKISTREKMETAMTTLRGRAARGSGGARGIGVSARVLILENAYYSVISPEGCAAILWKDRNAAPQAAEALKITAKDLLELELVDEIVPEPLGGAHNDHSAMADTLREVLLRNLEELRQIDPEERLKQRYQKYRRHGKFIEE